MRARYITAAALVGLLAYGSSAGASTSRYNQSVAEVQIDSRPCLFFNLNGVSQADPSVSGEKWFAIPTGSPNYTTLASILLSGKVSGRQVYVITDGSATCGYATASIIGLD